MMNQYETVFILTPVLSEEQMKETVKKFSGYLAENGGEIVHEDNWGLRKLAYPIQKKSTGFYHLIEFKANGELVNRLEVEFRRDEKIIRFLTVKLDKFAVEYNLKRRKLASNEPIKEKLEE
jgi:small subunit ribosomal protein S6